MDEEPYICLIDLSAQLPFEIDDAVKKEICFGETLLISCGHCDGDIGEESSDSEWSCHDTTESESSEEVKDDTMFEVKDKVEDETVPEEVPEEENDFHFYFFPECNKPLPPRDSKASLIIVNGMPQVNPAAKGQILCTCDVDKQGKCKCHVKLPCSCGAKTVKECTCSKLDKICICRGEPIPVCTCRESKVCVCHPDGIMQPVCTCDIIDKPCICHPGKFPSPICKCKYKPKFLEELKDIGEENEQIGEEEDIEIEMHDGVEPCECQKPEPEQPCVCEPTESREQICKSDDSKTICECTKQIECTCEGNKDDCKCFSKPVCTCGNPVDCKCFAICDCPDPCICDTSVKKMPECICLDESKLACTCPIKGEEAPKKLKRVRAGKHGYRWCHDVDPRHTYFDYGYGRHDRISYKEKDVEKTKILGLYEEKQEKEACAVHGVNAPPYKKKVRKPSIDCCSTVGGISICVETLGEDKDKFLVQVVSHSSKEGAKSGSKLVSILDSNLHTMEENRTEYLTKKDVTKESRSYMAICESGYYNKVTRICGDKNVVKRHYHSFKDARNFLLEGANVVLMRYFGLKRYRGNIKTETVLMDGTICESIYVCYGVSQAIVNGKPLFVAKVERHVIEPSGYIHQSLTVLTLRGYMVSHEWADNNYVLHINPLLNIVPEKDEIEPHAPLRERWRDDLQLLSDYLDFKSTRSAEGGRYVSESGALTGTVRDYLQALLLLRPHDALHFTQHYFNAALSSLDLPHDDYFDPTSKHVRYYFFES